jgi:hypothetical protein
MDRMDAKVGDRISLDAKKVGQARRTGSVRALVEGLSGVRYEIAWDDGSVSVISPGAGVLLVEKKAKAAAKKKDKKKPAAKKAKRTKGR